MLLPPCTDGRVLELVDIRSKRRSSALYPTSDASDDEPVADLGESNALGLAAPGLLRLLRSAQT